VQYTPAQFAAIAIERRFCDGADVCRIETARPATEAEGA
jgi:hypothetical protein